MYTFYPLLKHFRSFLSLGTTQALAQSLHPLFKEQPDFFFNFSSGINKQPWKNVGREYSGCSMSSSSRIMVSSQESVSA